MIQRTHILHIMQTVVSRNNIVISAGSP
ncbi:hypothetical protein ECEC1846_2768, partial [Escherichia coli EC1846]